MRTWTKLALAVLLAVPFTLAPLRAADPESTAQKVDQLRRELDALNAKVDKIQSDLLDSNARGAKTALDILDIKDLLQRMASRQEQINRQQSNFGPDPQAAVPGNVGPANTSTARVLLRNQYPATPVTVRLNGRSYTVEPNRTLTVGDVPVGPLTYEVYVEGYQLQPTTVTLSPRGRLINVYPLEP